MSAVKKEHAQRLFRQKKFTDTSIPDDFNMIASDRQTFRFMMILRCDPTRRIITQMVDIAIHSAYGIWGLLALMAKESTVGGLSMPALGRLSRDIRFFLYAGFWRRGDAVLEARLSMRWVRCTDQEPDKRP